MIKIGQVVWALSHADKRYDIMNFIFRSEIISNTWKYCEAKVATCEGGSKS